MVEANILVSALAGTGSFFSPCILPILPAFISYLSGSTINEVQSSETNSNFKGHALTIRKSTRLNIFLKHCVLCSWFFTSICSTWCHFK